VTIITVLTDFGVRDPYVGIMKGVMLGINPHLHIVDITHEVDPQDVEEASFLIGEYFPHFPGTAIHLCVVDPTVGSARKPLIVVKEGHMFVGPDNGIFSLLFGRGEARAYEITNRRFMGEALSGTFHGRDVFAPAAAHLSAGISPSEFGPVLVEPVVLRGLLPSIEHDTMEGRIVRFDRFGNAISNIAFDFFKDFVGNRPFTIELSSLAFQSLNHSYYESRHTCLVGSSGYLEFGLFMGSLAQYPGIRKDESVRVRRRLP
jgi:S-adenosylmethionine hydrolase